MSFFGASQGDERHAEMPVDDSDDPFLTSAASPQHHTAPARLLPFSIASSDLGFTSPTSLEPDVRSVLGILNPTASGEPIFNAPLTTFFAPQPSTLQPSPTGAVVSTRRRKGKGKANQQDGDEESMGPPQSLMIDLPTEEDDDGSNHSEISPTPSMKHHSPCLEGQPPLASTSDHGLDSTAFFTAPKSTSSRREPPLTEETRRQRHEFVTNEKTWWQNAIDTWKAERLNWANVGFQGVTLPTSQRRRSKRVGPLHLDGLREEVEGDVEEEDGEERKKREKGERREKALWRWVNVDDLDAFLQEVYMYYTGKGIWVIGLSRLLSLLTVGFVIGFSTFLLGCIDYTHLRQSHHLSQVIVSRCVARFSGLTLMIVIVVSGFYTWKVLKFGQGAARLWVMSDFFTELLEIPEKDIPTVPWHVIVDRLSLLCSQHPSRFSSSLPLPTTTTQTKQQPTERKLDAQDVANRIMREENYLIALFNREVLNLKPPLPWFLSSSGGQEGELTRTLEWNLSFCLHGCLFDERGQVQSQVMVRQNRHVLVETLKRRFILMGFINATFAPFIVVYLLMYSFFRYFEEYHKNPSTIGSRSYTPLARWKFREFNELPHIFKTRLDQSHTPACDYVDQFPKEKTVLVARFVAFISGSFASILILLSIFDPDAFLHFEVTEERSVLFYIGVFGTLIAISRGMVPDEHSKVKLPEELMSLVVEHTHYLPKSWRGQLHSSQVHDEFGKLFPMKAVTFFKEVWSVVVTPWVLWYALPNCSGDIVDFFREYTVHVEGVGYVCSFAVFDFTRHGDASRQQAHPATLNNDGKMEKSLLNFQACHPNWEPSNNEAASLYLSRMTDFAGTLGGFTPTARRGRGGGARSRHWPRASTSRAAGHHYALGVQAIDEEEKDDAEADDDEDPFVSGGSAPVEATKTATTATAGGAGVGQLLGEVWGRTW